MTHQIENRPKSPMDSFLETEAFKVFCERKFCGEAFSEDLSLDLIDRWPRGYSKACRVLIGNRNKRIIVKEIRYDSLHVSSNVFRTISPFFSVQDALLEIKIIRHIKKKMEAGVLENFSQNYGTIGFSHARFEDNKIVRKSEIVSAKTAHDLHELYGLGVSFFIIDEYINGRAPTGTELEKAKIMKTEGILIDPKTWLTVDVDIDDIKVSETGKIFFIDVGKFGFTWPQPHQQYGTANSIGQIAKSLHMPKQRKKAVLNPYCDRYAIPNG